MRKISLVFMCLLWCATSCLSSEKIDVYILAERGTPEQLQEALENGAEFNVSRATKAEGDEEIATDWWFFDGGETPLHHAAAYNHNPESIRFLIAQSIDVNAKAEDKAEDHRPLSETPLSRAIRYKNLEATLELLKAGADPNFWSLCEGFNGNMLDIVAIEYLDDNYATQTVIDALMKAGAKINDHYEVEQGEKKAMLLLRRQWTSNNPSENMKDNLSTAEMDKFMMSCTPLIYAALGDNPEVVNILLDYNADPNITNIENKTALDYAEELPEDSRLKKSPAFARLKAATTVENKAVESDLDFERADKLVGEGKIPMYVRDKGKFFYNHNLQKIKSGRVAVNVQKLNLRSQPNTKARIVAKIGREDTEKYPWYLGEWTSPQGEHWVLGEYQHSNGRNEAVWLYGKYVEVMGINSYYGRVYEIQAEQREIIEAVRNTMYYPPYTAYNDYLPVGQQLERASLAQWEWSISENGPSGFEKRVAVFRVHGRNRFNNRMLEMTVAFGRTTKDLNIFGLNRGDLALLAVIINGEVCYQFGVHLNRMTARQFFNFIYTGEIY